VVEGTPLLRAQTVKSCLEGSNPFFSAIPPGFWAFQRRWGRSIKHHFFSACMLFLVNTCRTPRRDSGLYVQCSYTGIESTAALLVDVGRA
jgi:hypothetical protein